MGGGPTAQPVTIGTYGLSPGLSLSQHMAEQKRAISVPCPYCREPLIQRVTTRQWVRNIKEDGDAFLAVDIPSHLEVVACFPCDARFVIPKERSAWPATD